VEYSGGVGNYSTNPVGGTIQVEYSIGAEIKFGAVWASYGVNSGYLTWEQMANTQRGVTQETCYCMGAGG
jgi:hypothetical protein